MRKHYRPSADEVRQLRVANGMTQRVLADLLAMSTKSVEAYERGARKMTASTWQLMCLMAPAVGGYSPDDDWPSV